MTEFRRASITLALTTTLVAGACAVQSPPPDVAPAAPKQLRVLATNDVHGRLTAEPASWAGGARVGGITELATAFDRERASFTAGPTILLDGGDVMQGTPVSNLTRGRSTVDAFNAAGYTAGAIGNHEFDWGVAVLQERIAQATWSWLSANIVVAGSDTAPSWVKPTAMRTINGVRVGFIGLTTVETPQTTHAGNVAALTFTDGAAAINRWVPVLRRAGADFVIVVAHAGAFCEANFANCRGEVIDWANRATARPDLIVGGHTHQVVQTVVNRIPIIEAGSYGGRYGVVDLARVTADSVDARMRGVSVFADSTAAHPVVAAIVERYRQEIGPEIERVIGVAATAVPRGAGENPMGRLIADGQRFVTKAQVAIMNSGGIRAPIDEGPITWSEAFQVHPFGNRLVVLRLRGVDLRGALEHAVAGSNVQAQVSGLTATYDPTRPAGSRIVSITLDGGAPVRDDEIYDVVVNDFLATGVGDGFTSFGKALEQRSTGIVDLDALLQYITRLGQVTADTQQRLRVVNAR